MDLAVYRDGRTYCISCMVCPHGNGGTTSVCTTCFRQLHTIMTASGPRIRDVEVYAICARDEYGVNPFDLPVWIFDEEEQLHGLDMLMQSLMTKPDVFGAPPHHRFG